MTFGNMSLAEIQANPVAAIRQCMEDEPLLHGGGVADAFYLKQYGRDALAINRQELEGPKGVAQVLRAAEFIAVAPRRATVNLRRSCYGWKHVAERWHKARFPGKDYYIGEGSFLVACWAMGVLVKRHNTAGYQVGLAEAARELVA
ncbi:hypothetical protein BKE38_05145 [Pseudoroseomonas deserti]|uniref:Uncharacterized protein n=1 Tax=Teichococcus deserti TaxID=1817963 RepID=A0A1V2H6U7_9PROT|nr:hypothetical protein [Pseudoroseomonas deserti]ONG56981.1 hypothetical protein BKE38_05145 [Pseudoroseomonas deserti]